MSKKFNYEAVTVDKVNKYVSNMIKNLDAYRVMELLSDAKAVQNSPLMKEEDMDTLAMAMDELIVTPTPKEDMAVCKIINHILHKYNLELPNDDSECIEMMIQMIGDTIAENKLGSTTEIAYTAFSDVLQGLCHQDVMSGIDDQDVLETCAFICFVNAAVSCTMDNMYEDIAASKPKSNDADKKKEDIAVEKLQAAALEYFGKVADILGYKGDAKDKFVKSMMENAAENLNEICKGKTKQGSKPDIKSSKETDKPSKEETAEVVDVYQPGLRDKIVTHIADKIHYLLVSKFKNITGCIEFDQGYLYNKSKESIQGFIDSMSSGEIKDDDDFIESFKEKHLDEVSDCAINASLEKIVTEFTSTVKLENTEDGAKMLQLIANAKRLNKQRRFYPN